MRQGERPGGQVTFRSWWVRFLDREKGTEEGGETDMGVCWTVFRTEKMGEFSST